MIIRLTVRDNDFTSIIEDFASSLYWQDSCPRDTMNIREFWNDMERFRDMWGEVINGSGKLTPEQQSEFLEIVLRKFETYIRRRFDGDGDDALHRDYLLAKIEVKLQKSLTPRWENGEVVYVFPNAGGKHLTF